jgi:hypothetical protein
MQICVLMSSRTVIHRTTNQRMAYPAVECLEPFGYPSNPNWWVGCGPFGVSQKTSIPGPLLRTYSRIDATNEDETKQDSPMYAV